MSNFVKNTNAIGDRPRNSEPRSFYEDDNMTSIFLSKHPHHTNVRVLIHEKSKHASVPPTWRIFSPGKKITEPPEHHRIDACTVNRCLYPPPPGP
ncbi:hypothetical protein TNCV_3038891 [Trichonephila clavipes]|nr:hypothetical protein TNCV_3038891 [Trichonephila clavipes]